MSIKLYIFCASRPDSAPTQHEFSKALPLAAHLQKLCTHFGISEDASQYALQVDNTKQYLNENDFKGKNLTIPPGARIMLIKSLKHQALDIVEKLNTVAPEKTKII